VGGTLCCPLNSLSVSQSGSQVTAVAVFGSGPSQSYCGVTTNQTFTDMFTPFQYTTTPVVAGAILTNDIE